jgi:hypothetical protein
MESSDRTRSPHVKLQEFLDCFVESDHKKELESFSSPQLTGSMREQTADEALRYLALVLLYAIDEKGKDVSFIRKRPDETVCRMAGDKFYDIPTPKEEVVTALFDEIEDMAGMDETKRTGKLVLGLGNDQIEVDISSTLTDAKEEKILIQLPPLA